jgi:hypothetical protein
LASKPRLAVVLASPEVLRGLAIAGNRIVQGAHREPCSGTRRDAFVEVISYVRFMEVSARGWQLFRSSQRMLSGRVSPMAPAR